MSNTGITSQEVEKIAKLSRLKLTEDEVVQAAKNLSDILNHFAVIQNIQTKDVLPTVNASDQRNVTRMDIAKENHLCKPEDLIAAAPGVRGRHIEVKAAL